MSARGNVTSIATLRGKVVETGQDVEIQAPRRRRRRPGWRDAVSLVDMGQMAKLELTGTEYRVLNAVMAHIPPKSGAEAFCTMQEIADDLDIAVSSVSRAMKALKSRRIIIRRTNRVGRWHVNTWLAYSGDFDSWNAAADEDPEPIWTRVDPMTGEIR